MARFLPLCLLVGLLGCAASVQAQVSDALKKAGLTQAAALFEAAGVAAPLSAGKTWTALVPTNAAVEAFLKDMGLTLADLKSRPGLAKAIAGQHLVLRHNVRAQELFADGPSRLVASAAGRGNELLFTKAKDGKVTVEGRQGVSASVDPAYLAIDENKTAHKIDRVLLSDKYYVSFKSLCAQRDTVADFCRAVVYAGLGETVNAAGFSATLFVPNNKAFTAVRLAGAKPPPPAKVADVLKYHVLAGPAREIPRAIPADTPLETLLPKATLKLAYKQVTHAKSGLKVLEASVVPADGKAARIVRANVYVGRSIVNGIDAVLMPGAAAATKPAATPAPKAGTGRRLLGFGWGAEAGQEASEDQSASDIQAAVDGNESAAQAGQQTMLGSQELSVPGDWNQVDEGINPW